jgi:tetratricopeptide (TPR) repeat protein
MAQRNPGKRSPAGKPRPETPAPGGAGERVRRLLLAAVTAVCVATPLIPGETSESGGGVMLILLWLLLLVAWSVSAAAFAWKRVPWGWTDTMFVVLVGLHALSALVAIRRGDARAAINLLWQWIGFGACFLLVRQLVRHACQRRALCVVFVALAVGLSAFAFYQVAYSLPQTRADFARDPEGALREAGIEAPPGSPERKLYEDRLQSTEPSATFALTNSLAGFLAPWLALVIGLGVFGSPPREGRAWRRLATVAVIAIVLGFCLLLTKSRTAVLASLLGLVLLGGRAWSGGRRIGWRKPLAAATVLALLFAVAMATGALDRLVVSEAPKSVLYRWQYWQASLRMIADHPWFGCGPGNFQYEYTAYKLPEASETIKDPHNFLLEVWATAGTPALLALVAVGLAFLWQVRSRSAVRRGSPDPAGTFDRRSPELPGDLRSGRCRGRETGTQPSSQGVGPASRILSATTTLGTQPVSWMYAGGVAGVLLAYPTGAVAGFSPEIALGFVLLPPAVLAVTALHGWVARGRLTLDVLVLPLIVLYVNLLAAGGINFAGVAQTGWVLLALALNHLDETRQAARERERPDVTGIPASVAGAASRPVALGRIAIAVGLLTAFGLTMYRPVLERQILLANGMEYEARLRWDQAEAAYQAAGDVDPYAAEPWLRLAALYYHLALTSPMEKIGPKFDRAVAEIVAREPHSQAAWQQIGDWRLALYRSGGDRVQLEAALAAYAERVRRYPNSSHAHAQLAWAYHVAGQREQAAMEAQQALRLDALNPHRERKLAAQQVFEPKDSQRTGANAEQCMHRLRR